MKLSVHLLFLSLLVFAFNVEAQQQAEPENHHEHDIYQQIERDYEEGQLNIDQKVLFKFYASHKPERLPADYQSNQTATVKCGNPAILDFKRNRSKLSPSTISTIESNTDPQISASETYTSSSGRFEIHYVTTDDHAVPLKDSDGDGTPDYVEQVAAAADSSYRHLVQTLGYSDPIAQGEVYRIEIRDVAPIYGETLPPSHSANPYNNTLIRIENDFAEDFPSNDHPDGNQVGAINATIAHEFKHAIQYAASQFRGETANWLEMDATLMEEVVYDDVNDYYNYLTWNSSIFNSPGSGFYPGSYEHVSWALFFEEKYGSHFWVDVWEIIKQDPSGTTLIGALKQQLGGAEAFRRDYTESHLWHYASGENSSPDYGFEESTNYPTASLNIEDFFYTENFSIPRSTNSDSINGFAAKYYRLPNKMNSSGKVSLEFQIENPDNGVGLIARKKTGDLSIYISKDNSDLATLDINWNEISNLGLVLSNASTNENNYGKIINIAVGDNNFETTLSHNYPNPFNPQTRIRFTVDQPSHVELKVYDSAGRLVTTLINEELSPGLYEPIFDGRGLASGIYFYQLKTDQQTETKQMTLIK